LFYRFFVVGPAGENNIYAWLFFQHLSQFAPVVGGPGFVQTFQNRQATCARMN